MKVFSLRQFSKNRVALIVLCSLAVSYFFVYLLLKELNGIVFKEPVIFDHSAQVEGILKQVIENNKSDISNLSVVYFWKRYCPCNLGVGAHYTDLFNEYGQVGLDNTNHNSKGVDFYIADLSGRKKSSVSLVKSSPEGDVLAENISAQLSEYVPYAPAIAVFNAQNELVYYGPHSLGFVCNADTSIVRKVIASLKQGILSKSTNVVGEGCFCAVSS